LWHVPPPSRKTVNIGFAGTEHHYDNLQLLRGALEPVAAGYPDVRIIEAGGPALLSLLEAAAEQMIHLGKLPFEVFPLLLHQMDIVLAPLVDSAFTRAKSRIRCMMAGLVGAPVVASPVGTYAEFVEHGVNGFYARSPAEWTHYLEQLVRDAELRRRMGCMNRQRAEAWSISQNIWRWTEVYESVLHRRRCA
jgi:glycosyltransferase involved in cell wall biosynthesis